MELTKTIHRWAKSLFISRASQIPNQLPISETIRQCRKALHSFSILPAAYFHLFCIYHRQ